MGEYWGIEAISARLGISPTTAWRWHRTRGLLLYKRRRRGHGCWYTNDALLLSWERDVCRQDLERVKRQAEVRRARKQKNLEA